MNLSSEQLELRRQGVGSSDIGAIAGLNPFRSPLAVWLEKTGRSEFEGNRRTRYGHRVETAIAEDVADEFDLGQPVPCERTYRASDNPIVLATPDFEIGDDGILETKHVGLNLLHHWEHGPPEYVVAQLLWQGRATGRRSLWVGAAIAGNPPEAFPVPYDEDYAEGLVAIAVEFWERFIDGHDQPPLDHGPATAEYLRKTYPGNVGTYKNADALITEEIARAKDAYLRMKRAERELDLCQHRIDEFIAEADGVHSDFGKITWKLQKARVRDSAVIAELAKRAGVSAAELDALKNKHRGDPPRVHLWPSRAWLRELDNE